MLLYIQRGTCLMAFKRGVRNNIKSAHSIHKYVKGEKKKFIEKEKDSEPADLEILSEEKDESFDNYLKMTYNELRVLAKQYGIKSSRKRKLQLIEEIIKYNEDEAT